jgi:hypothetical protein
MLGNNQKSRDFLTVIGLPVGAVAQLFRVQ